MSLRSLSDTFDLTLLQQITRKIIQVQSLHDHDDRAPGLVVDAGEQCIGEPLLDRLPLYSDCASCGLSGSSMMIMSPPRPVNIR